jgi:hypothetical protein
VISVELRDENCRPYDDSLPAITAIGFELARVLPNEDDLEFPLLRLVDPYGDTVFNRLQMRQLIPELERLASRSKSAAVDQVLTMARVCASEVHSYLVFVGD